MTMYNLREISKNNLEFYKSDADTFSNERIITSAMLRISDSLESINKNIIKLIETQKCKEKK